jgi:hypothetical protein
MDLEPGAIVTPLSKVVVDRLVVGVVLGQIGPRAIGAKDIEDGIDHSA